MKRYCFRSILLLSLLFVLSSAVRAADVVRLESSAGTAAEYEVTELLRVEFVGNHIRFIASDGSLVTEVYKYDYTRLIVAANAPTAVTQPAADSQPMARKVIIDGQVYILLGDKAYLITGTPVRGR